MQFLIVLLLFVSGLPGCQHLEVSDEAIPSLESWDEQESKFTFLPGDEFDVRFRYSPEFNDRVVVGPDGRVQLSLVGSVLASDKSPAELSVELQKLYAKDLKSPDLSIIPRSFGSETVYLGGELGQPGSHRLLPGMTVSAAIMAAGGPFETANIEEILLLRPTKRHTNMIRKINLKAILEGKASEDDLRLRRFDVVLVPRSGIAEADRITQQYFRKLMPFNSQAYIGVVPK